MIWIGYSLNGSPMAAIFGKKFVPMISSGIELPMSMHSLGAKKYLRSWEIPLMLKNAPQSETLSHPHLLGTGLALTYVSQQTDL
jgi:hypothetical protein